MNGTRHHPILYFAIDKIFVLFCGDEFTSFFIYILIAQKEKKL